VRHDPREIERGLPALRVQHNRCRPQGRGLRLLALTCGLVCASDLRLYLLDFFGHFSSLLGAGVKSNPLFLGVCEKGDLRLIARMCLFANGFFWQPPAPAHMCQRKWIFLSPLYAGVWANGFF